MSTTAGLVFIALVAWVLMTVSIPGANTSIDAGLTIAAAPGANDVHIAGPFGSTGVTDIGLDQTVLFRGISFFYAFCCNGLSVTNCAGPVRFLDCDAWPQGGTSSTELADDLVFVRCELEARPTPDGFSGNPGLWQSQSVSYLYACELLGGRGDPPSSTSTNANDGGAGMLALESFVFADDTVLAVRCRSASLARATFDGCLP